MKKQVVATNKNLALFANHGGMMSEELSGIDVDNKDYVYNGLPGTTLYNRVFLTGVDLNNLVVRRCDQSWLNQFEGRPVRVKNTMQHFTVVSILNERRVLLQDTQTSELEIRKLEDCVFPHVDKEADIVFSGVKVADIVTLNYELSGIGWNLDYNIVLNDSMRLRAEAVITNDSNDVIKADKISLTTAQAALHPQPRLMMAKAMDTVEPETTAGVDVYSLDEAITLNPQSVTRRALFKYEDIEYQLENHVGRYSTVAQTKLRFVNPHSHGLPQGDVIVFAGDPITVIGRDTIDGRTADVGNEVVVNLGDNPSVRSKFVEQERKLQDDKTIITQSYQLNNLGNKLTNVIIETVIEPFAKVKETSHEYSIPEATHLRFEVSLEANEKTTVAYTYEVKRDQ